MPPTHRSDTSRRSQVPSPLAKLVAFGPMPSRHRSATVAGLCTTAPVLVGHAAGQPVVGLVASTGALAALYGGRGTPRQDATAVTGAALSLALGMAVGGSLAGDARLAVIGTALWAALLTAVFAMARARPPGITMPVLVCSVGTGLPPGDTVRRACAVAAVGLIAALLSWLVARVLPRRAAAASPAPPGAGPLVQVRLALAALPRSPFGWMAVRTGAAVGLAGAASLLCGVGRPYWAMAAAAAVLARGSHAMSANTRATLRGLGTAVGCLLAGALASAHPGVVTTAVLLGALTFVIELVVARNYAVAMVFVTPLSVLLVTSATHASAVLTITADRLLETVLGCAAAVVAGQLVSRRWAVRHHRQAVADVLTAAAALVEDPPSLVRAAALRDARAQLLLVSERTAGERRGVRTATSGLDRLTAAAAGTAGELLENPAVPGETAADSAYRLHALAALVDPCAPDQADPAGVTAVLGTPLTELCAAVDAWLAGQPYRHRAPHRFGVLGPRAGARR
ncbi:FUSC family protein [Streptomyces sp. NPDC005498]|uniref:FUSC family protein n=1 Tax=Streptomyces sp. NPDC005498 TaxID=3364717 RepID=UPI0036BFD461